VLPHAAIGAALGGVGGLGESQVNYEPLRAKADALEAQPDLSATDTAKLVGLRTLHTMGSFSNRHPMAAAGMGALTGGVFGATQGPGIVDAAREGGLEAGRIPKNVKDLFTRGAA
jgi:hypothetical protein